MPSKSKAQHKLMAAVANNPKFAKKAGIPQSVGKDFTNADKGKTFKEGGMPSMKKDKKTLRNLNDESYRIRNNTGSNAAAERRRVDGERAFEKRQMSKMKMGGKVEYKSGGMAQGFNARLDDSMGAKNGKKSQSMASRRNESKGMEKSKGKGAYSGDTKMMSSGGLTGGKKRSIDGIADRGRTRCKGDS